MTTPQSAESTAPLGREWLQAARYYLGNRWILVTLGTIVIVIGLAFNWSWLVATGVAPIVLTALPCLVMCGLGLCMNRLFGNSCESQPSQAQKPAESTAASFAAMKATNDSPGPASNCCHEQSSASRPADLNQLESLEERRKSDA